MKIGVIISDTLALKLPLLVRHFTHCASSLLFYLQFSHVSCDFTIRPSLSMMTALQDKFLVDHCLMLGNA